MSTPITRQIVLDTETTGMNMAGGATYLGHRIIEIGAVEVIDRRLTGNHFHVYIKPDRLVDPAAFAVHGISDEFLADKSLFDEVAEDFFEFIKGAELVIHNAAFDVGFIDNEFRLLKVRNGKEYPNVESFCSVTDSLMLARRMFPGKRNNLDALADRYFIDNSHRTLHGALLDAEILAEVYLAMTGGQTSLSFTSEAEKNSKVSGEGIQRIIRPQSGLKVIYASESEVTEHESRLDLVAKKSSCLWRA